MKRFLRSVAVVGSASLVAGLLSVVAVTVVAEPAFAADAVCTDSVATGGMGGTINGANECEISVVTVFTGNTSRTLSETLRIKSGGALIVAGPSSMTLVINAGNGTPGDLILESNAALIQTSDVTDLNDASAGPINITVANDMVMQPGSKILATNAGDGNAAAITIDVNGDKMVMCGPNGAIDPGCDSPPPGVPGGLAGALIDSSSGKNGTSAGNVTIHVGDYPNNPVGQFLMEAGSQILAKTVGGQGGNVLITAGEKAVLDGTIWSAATGSTGSGAGHDGGWIYVQTGCGIEVGGLIETQGSDQGANKIHLDSCEVVIKSTGQVLSVGVGHEVNPDPDTLCLRASDPGATSCVEIWAKVFKVEVGGQVFAQATQGTMWIDIFAEEKVELNGLTGVNDPYAVAADQGGPGNSGTAGKIKVLVESGPFLSAGNALSATAFEDGGKGGNIRVEAQGEATPCCAIVPPVTGVTTGNTTRITTQANGFGGTGGTIFLKAYNNAITGTAQIPVPPPPPNLPGPPYTPTSLETRGRIGDNPSPGLTTLEACVNPAGTFTGNVMGPRVDSVVACGGAPTIPLTDNKSGLDFQELKVVWANCGGEDTFSVSGKKVRADTEPAQGLGGWTIRLYGPENPPGSGTFPFIVSTVTAADGTYSFPLPGPGTYKLCEVIADHPDWTQVLPAGPAVCNTANPPGEAANGHVFSTGDGGGDQTANCCGGEGVEIKIKDKDFSNRERPPGPPECQKPTMYLGMDGAFPGHNEPDVTIVTETTTPSIQDAVDNVTDTSGDGYLIVLVIAHADGSLGGTIPQKVAVTKNYDAVGSPTENKPFGLFGCSVTLTGGGADPSLWIKTTANSNNATNNFAVNGKPTTIFTMDVHGSNSSAAGVQADGTKRYIRNTYGTGSAIGIKVYGDSNVVHNGKGEGNSGPGVKVNGNSNYLTDTDSFSNTGDGFNVTGNSNQLLKLNPGDKNKGNGGDGVEVNGNSNTLQEIKSYANSGWGILVNGNSNSLKKNVAGDSGKVNGLGGIKVSGTGNQLEENTAKYNTGPGFAATGGTSGAPNNFVKKNQGTNQTVEYALNNYVRNQSGENKADGVIVPKTSAPTKCVGTFPAQGATTNFANTTCP
jgi:hypothetical protein